MPRISPDGQTLAFNATDTEGEGADLDPAAQRARAAASAGHGGREPRPSGLRTAGSSPFSPAAKLKKIDVAGGPPTKVCDAPTGSDGTWSSEGVILYDGTANDPIHRVPAAGGTPVAAVKPDVARKETQVGWPEFLPDGRHFMYMSINQKVDDSAYRIGALDSTETKAFAPAQTMLTYAPPGYLLFVRDRTLVAQPFDAKAQKTTGEPVPLAEQIGTDSVGLAQFSVSRDGVLAYRTGESGNRLVWMDRSGKELETLGDPGDYSQPSLSPSGDRIAFDLWKCALASPTSGSGIWRAE